MKVLMFGWEFPPHNSGGLGVACYGLARALANKNIEITFVLPKRLDIKADFVKLVFADIPNLNTRGVNSLLYPYVTSSSYLKRLGSASLNMYGATLLEEVARYAKLAAEIAKKEQFDVIHAHDWLSIGAGVEAKKVSGKPLIVHFHATEYDRSGGNNVNSDVYEIEKEGIENADKVVAVSAFTKELLSSKYGADEGKIEVVYNGVELPAPEHMQEEVNNLMELKKAGYKMVLYLGRITLQKGPDYFVKMAKRVLEFYPKVMFVVVGNGDMERQMIEETAYLGISDKFIFTGWLRKDKDDVTKIFRAADLLVMPSVSEPFGIVPLECLLSGTPVLVSKQSGVSEVLSHALKTDFWDVDDMTDKVLAVLNHGSLHDTLRDNGQVEAKRCTWGRAADRIVEIYQGLISPAVVFA